MTDEFKVQDDNPEVMYRAQRIVFTVLLIGGIFAVAVPQVLDRDGITVESRAIGALKAVAAAQESYRAANDGYAADFRELMAPTEGSAHLDEALFERRSTYGYDMKETEAGFAAIATPQSPEKGIHRSFYVDETGVIRCARGLPTASKTSETLEAWEASPWWAFWK